MATVRKRGDSWQIDYFDPNGKRVRQSFKKKKDAEAELGKRVSLIAENPKRYLEKAKEYTHTFGQLCERYTEAFGDQASFKTSKAYYLENFKSHFSESTLLGNITYYELEKYRDHLKKKPTRHGNLRTVRAVNVEIGILSQMFSKAKSWGMIESNPFDDGDSLRLKGENVRKQFLEEKQIPQLLLAAQPHLQPIIETAIHLGTRPGKEILSIKWRDVDFNKGTVRIKRNKTGNIDHVPMNPDLEALFKRLRPKKADPDAHVFLYEGKPIRSVLRSFKQACKKAGIPYGLNVRGGIVFHDLRHTCASHLIMRGASLKEVQEHLGHENISTTDRYLHLTEEAKKKTACRLSGITSIPEAVQEAK